MQIQGTLTVEGVELHVHIDAPDNASELYVTNIPPNSLLMPRERVRIEWLGLSQDLLGELRRKGIQHLSDLVDEQWTLASHRLSEGEREVIGEALRQFLAAALVFEFSEETATPEELVRGQERLEELRCMLQRGSQNSETTEETPLISQEFPLREYVTQNGVLDEDIGVLGLPAGVTQELRRELGIRRLRDFREHRREHIFALRYLQSEKMRARLTDALRQKGVELPTGSLNDG